MPFNVGPVELVIVLVIALLVVGPRRLPEMGNAVGKTIREFRKASSEVSEATSLEPEAKPDAAPAPETTTAPPPAAPPPAGGAQTPAGPIPISPVPNTAAVPETTEEPPPAAVRRRDEFRNLDVLQQDGG